MSEFFLGEDLAADYNRMIEASGKRALDLGYASDIVRLVRMLDSRGAIDWSRLHEDATDEVLRDKIPEIEPLGFGDGYDDIISTLDDLERLEVEREQRAESALRELTGGSADDTAAETPGTDVENGGLAGS